MREEFSPFSGGSHMVDDPGAELFVFSGGVGTIEDTILLMLEGDASETVRTRLAIMQIETLRRSPRIRTESHIIRRERAQTFQAPFPCRIVAVVGILRPSSRRYVFEVFAFAIIETVVAV